mgnify:CR=1 FL=1
MRHGRAALGGGDARDGRHDEHDREGQAEADKGDEGYELYLARMRGMPAYELVQALDAPYLLPSGDEDMPWDRAAAQVLVGPAGGGGVGGVGINTTTPHSMLEISEGDIFINNIHRGVIMKTPGGKCYRYQPDESGKLLAKEVDCPDS